MTRAWIAIALSLAAPLAAQPETQETAWAAYERKDYAACGAIFSRLDQHFNAASCFALAGNKDAAFAHLEKAVAAGWSNTKRLRQDADLASLRADARWKNVMAGSEANWTKKFGNDNRELWTLREGDEADRESEKTGDELKAAIERDRARLARAKEIIAAGGLKTANDYFMAAMLLQHGVAPEDYQKAREIALRAAELDPGNKRATWLAAAAQDRYLWSIGKPQMYGTQFKQVDGVWTVEPLDPAVTDAERAKWNVPPIAEARKRAENMNQKKQ